MRSTKIHAALRPVRSDVANCLILRRRLHHVCLGIRIFSHVDCPDRGKLSLLRLKHRLKLKSVKLKVQGTALFHGIVQCSCRNFDSGAVGRNQCRERAAVRIQCAKLQIESIAAAEGVSRMLRFFGACFHSRYGFTGQ